MRALPRAIPGGPGGLNLLERRVVESLTSVIIPLHDHVIFVSLVPPRTQNALHSMIRASASRRFTSRPARPSSSTRAIGDATRHGKLKPAVEAIRHTIVHQGFWQSKESSEKLCYAALHPPDPSLQDPPRSESLTVAVLARLNMCSELIKCPSKRQPIVSWKMLSNPFKPPRAGRN